MCKLIWRSTYDLALMKKTKITPLCFCKDGKYKRWEEIRYFIEEESGMLKTNREGCLLAFRATDFNKQAAAYPLGDDTDVQTIDLIILLKVPLPEKTFNNYVPASIQRQQHLDHVQLITKERRALYLYKYSQSCDEADKIELLQKLCRLDYETGHDQINSQKRNHPSRLIIKTSYPGFLLADGTPINWIDVPKVVPPDTWLCWRCLNYFTPGHYIDDCPSHTIAAWRPMSQRRPPTGLPKNTLVAIPWTDDITKVATAQFRDALNNLWELKETSITK